MRRNSTIQEEVEFMEDADLLREMESQYLKGERVKAKAKQKIKHDL